MTARRFYIETHGCQMNVYDSGVICDILMQHGHRPVGRAADADLILINTCSVRERAERKALSRLAEVSALRKRKPDLVVGIVGCMAQRLGRRLTEQGLGADLVVGPDCYGTLATILDRLARVRLPVVETAQDPGCIYTLRPRTHDTVTAFVTIMRGCNNFCSYCIVPYVRGRERSKPHASILREVEHLVDLGVREVTLIGQNVDSYDDGEVDFAGLLETVNRVEGLHRIRFTTSHPKDLTPEVIDCIRDLPKVCENLHLPLQSGSDRILSLMNRGYTYDRYLDLTQLARASVPDIAISTDIMVGFPTETNADHDATLAAMEEIEFDSAFMFRYSARDGTQAAQLEDDVADGVKTARLREVIDTQNTIVDVKKRAFMGKEVEILVEGESRREPGFVIGRTRKNWLAKLPRKGVSKGETLIAKVTGVTRWMITCDGMVRKVGA